MKWHFNLIRNSNSTTLIIWIFPVSCIWTFCVCVCVCIPKGNDASLNVFLVCIITRKIIKRCGCVGVWGGGGSVYIIENYTIYIFCIEDYNFYNWLPPIQYIWPYMELFLSILIWPNTVLYYTKTTTTTTITTK